RPWLYTLSLHDALPILGQHGPVGELHQRMNDGLRVDHNRNFFHGNSKKEMGLDRLQSLVHEGGGIHRDFCAHLPSRVLERIVDRSEEHTSELKSLAYLV